MTSRPVRSASLALSAALLALAACAPPSTSTAAAPRTSTSADSTNFYDISELEVKPQLSNPATVARALESNYPPALRNAGFGGTVTLDFVVEKDGRTSNIRVVRSEAGALDAPAIAVVRTMRFIPGMVAGAAVRTEVALPITFSSRR